MKRPKLLFIFLLGITSFGNRAWCQSYVSDADFDAITAQVESRFGQIYEIESTVNVDSSVHNAIVENGAIENPYGTLQGCIVFAAKGKFVSIDYDVPKGFVGIYRQGQVIWYSDTLISDEVVTGVRITGSTDLNNEGRVDIITSWYEGMRQQIEYLWIFSWDGHIGTLMNTVDEKDRSAIASKSDLFQFVDVNADGVKEIQGKWRETPDEEFRLVTYSWNGQLYGKWPSTPQPPASSYLPRNRVNITVKSFVRKLQNQLLYSYVIENKSSSVQEIDEILLYTKSLSVQNGSGRPKWRFRLLKRSLMGWTNLFLELNTIKRGEVDTSFSYESVGLPFITTYYVRGSNPSLIQPPYDEDARFRDKIENSVKGPTLGPADPPTPFNGLAFLDTLLSYTRQSAELRWLGRDRDDDCDDDERPDDGVVRNIENRLQKARRELVRGDSVKARKELLKLVRKVDRLQRRGERVMTSESYALLKYNTEYLIERLPERRRR